MLHPERKNLPTILCLFLLLLASQYTLPALAQPQWVTGAAAAKAPFSIAKEAHWLTLVDDVTVDYSADDVASHTTKQAFRILHPEGAEKGVITILTSPNHILHKLRGWHLSPGKDTEVLDEDNVIVTNPSASPGYYSDYRRSIAAFKNVKPGDVVAFEYELEETGPTARHHLHIFRDRQPQLQSQCSISYPAGYKVKYSGFGIDSVRRTETAISTVWAAIPSPCDPVEPLEPPDLSTSGVLMTVLTNNSKGSFDNWEKIVEWERERVEPAVAATPAIRDLAAKLSASSSLPWQKIAAAARFVQQEIRYVAVELGEGAWTPRPGSETLANRFGDCKDKVILLRSLLNAMEVPSASVLACTDGAVLPDVPSPFQFNHVILGVPTAALGTGHGWERAIADGWFFFDPTDASVPLGALPAVIQGDWVLVGAPGISGLTRLSPPTPADNLISVEGTGRIELDGRITAAIRMVFRGLSAYALRDALRSSPEAAKEAFIGLNEGIPDLSVSDTAVVDSVDSLVVALTARGHGLLSRSGAENLLRMNFLRFHEPVRLSGKNRVHPLWLGPAETEKIHFRWTLGEFLEGPDTLIRQENTCHGNSFATDVCSSNKEVEFTHSHTRSSEIIPAVEYGAVRLFLGSLERSITSSIQLRKTLP